MALGSGLAAADFDNNLEKTFEVGPGGKLVVEADRGTIEVTTAPVDKVQVRVLRRVKGGNKAETDKLFANHEVVFSQQGSTVSVVGKNKENLPRVSGPNSPQLEVRYEINIPKKFGADLKTAGADIRVGELDGTAKARTSSGTITLPQVTGKIEASNAGGDITIGAAGADLAALTSSGSIRVQQVGGPADLSNAGGDIHVGKAQEKVRAKTSSGTIDLKSVNGDLEAINAGGDIAAGTIGGTVQASTTSGSIKIGQVKGKSARVDNAGGSIQIETADGAVTAKTTSGRITIKKAKGAVEAKNAGGDINLDEAGGPLTATTTSGSITVKSANDSVNVRDAGGDIKVEQVKGAIQAHTSSARITVGLIASPPKDCALEVAGGDILMTVPKSIAVDLDAKSNGGSVRCDLPAANIVNREGGSGALRGKINGGGPKLFLRTTSGDIQLKASNITPKLEAEAEAK